MAAHLLASMDGPAEGVDAAWSAEIEARARHALAGEPRGIAWEVARERMRQRL